jgi:hypothetical protein
VGRGEAGPLGPGERLGAARPRAREVQGPGPGEPAGARGVHAQEGAPRLPADAGRDLQSARNQLLEAIEKINSTASQLFLDTFALVQTHFTDTFATLFVGGSAELRMVGDDPLECEIDILARPRGKNLQSISLLSSGERALTAIALLFAIYLIKPSPFCLLDEVDAPLDEANVDRFVALLKRFSEKTQFIMITHNKKTMEAAGALYGVTMQEPGVSKLVSVRFDTPETRQAAIEASRSRTAWSPPRSSSPRAATRAEILPARGLPNPVAGWRPGSSVTRAHSPGQFDPIPARETAPGQAAVDGFEHSQLDVRSRGREVAVDQQRDFIEPDRGPRPDRNALDIYRDHTRRFAGSPCRRA